MKTYKINELNSGWNKSRNSIGKVQEVKENLALVEAGNKTWIAKGQLTGRQLEKGQFVLASYNQDNQGADVYEILGFSDNDAKYGEGGVKFDSIKNVLKSKNVTSLKDLEDVPGAHKEYGEEIYLVVKDVQSKEFGPWGYLFNGRWSRGSGAEAMSFTELREFNLAEYEAEQAAKEKAQEKVRLENRKSYLQKQMVELQKQIEEIESQLKEY